MIFLKKKSPPSENKQIVNICPDEKNAWPIWRGSVFGMLRV
ncbi:hypothetical protein RLPCCGM1_c3663 [Rhizobium leguminosarum bv. phaseoli CCGM1]|nr:hypothetical protein RLPCCGM1_c3663 [Rhizobium leguminosarum bv. phaseoli CCGM1]